MGHWTRWVGIVAALVAVSGCMAGYRATTVSARYTASSRPHASYYCYDCHGDRFFDPYYDWCAYYGFQYAWSRHPEVVGLYRERYLRIKERHPEYGRYRYSADYRETRRYREPMDYEAWRRASRNGPGGETRSVERPKSREKSHDDAGTQQKPKGRERKEPRDRKSRDSLREGA
jgi:hypothetical protein